MCTHRCMLSLTFSDIGTLVESCQEVTSLLVGVITLARRDATGRLDRRRGWGRGASCCCRYSTQYWTLCTHTHDEHDRDKARQCSSESPHKHTNEWVEITSGRLCVRVRELPHKELMQLHTSMLGDLLTMYSPLFTHTVISYTHTLTNMDTHTHTRKTKAPHQATKGWRMTHPFLPFQACGVVLLDVGLQVLDGTGVGPHPFHMVPAGQEGREEYRHTNTTHTVYIQQLST